MKIELRNVGMLKNANIILEDIAVVVGKNNSGKSTIGKSVYTLLHSISEHQELNYKKETINLIKAKISNISVLIRLLQENEGEAKKQIFKLEKLEKNLNIDNLIKIKNEIIDIKNYYKNKERNIEVHREKNIDSGILNRKYLINSIIENSNIILNFLENDSSENSAKKRIIKKILEVEFDTPIKNNEKNLEIKIEDLELSYKNESVDFNYDKNKKYIWNEAILITTPMILNFMKMLDLSEINEFDYSHDSFLLQLLIEKKEKNIFEDILYKEINGIEKKIQEKLKGQLKYNESSSLIEFEDNSGRIFGQNDLATGVKSLGIIMMLLKKMNPSTVLILDEPEVHLHSEWQIFLAEIITLIVKRLRMKVLITSHSPIFLEAIEAYGKKEGLNNNFYYCEKGEVKKVDEEINLMFQKINGNALDMLDNILIKESDDLD